MTRAFAICLQEDSLFFHEILKEVLKVSVKKDFFSQLFDSIDSETKISIDIQQKTSQISDYEHIFAITLSETEIGNFWDSENNTNYDPICDLVIKINNVYLIIEAKRDNVDCTAQLYNQILNVVKSVETNTASLRKEVHEKVITPVDLNWSKLMKIAVRILSFEKSFGNTNRFLADFVSLVKNHNYRWLPEAPINSLLSNNRNSILRRIDSAIIEASKSNINISKLPYEDRLGIAFSKGWAQEILFNINKDGDLTLTIYPGNTKAQGLLLFETDPVFNKEIEVLKENYEVVKTYHIKFTSFQKYFTGLWFGENDLKDNLYTTENFNKFAGRKKRGVDWDDIEKLFDNYLEYNWKDKCKWNELIVNSGKSQFDISFGYEIKLNIPFERLKELDTNETDLHNLAKLVDEVYQKFSDNLLLTL